MQGLPEPSATGLIPLQIVLPSVRLDFSSKSFHDIIVDEVQRQVALWVRVD